MEFKDSRDFPLFPPKLTIAGVGDEAGVVGEGDPLYLLDLPHPHFSFL